MKTWAAFELEDLISKRKESGRAYLEFLRVPTLNCGLYFLKAGQEDRQSPHTLDEVYYVIEGRARFRADGEVTEVREGTTLFVKAGVEHRFLDIEEDLTILVMFAEAPSKKADK